jgi:hypothetical protein
LKELAEEYNIRSPAKLRQHAQIEARACMSLGPVSASDS